MGTVLYEATSPEGVIIMLLLHFLEDRTKQINEDLWMDQTFDLIKLGMPSKNEDIFIGSLLNDFVTLISDFSAIPAGSGYSAEVLAKIISA